MNEVQSLLIRAADSAGEFPVPTADSLRRRVHRTDRLRAIVAVAAVVVLVAGLAVALSHRTPARTPTAQRFDPSDLPGWSGPVVTAAQLKHYHWDPLPAAPINPRDGAVTVWSGTQLLVWGGESGHQYLSDGAAYSPRTRTWARLPAAPLSARSNAAAAWVDGRLVVWGGQDAHGWRSDGAAFDPQSGTWSALPSAPLSAESAQGFAVGSDFVVITSDPQHDSQTAHPAEYDMRSGTWRALPNLSVASGQKLAYIEGLAVGTTLLVWVYWYQSARVGPNTYSISGGSDAYAFQGETWTQVPFGPKRGTSAAGPLWTGSSLILGGEQTYCGPCSPPAPAALDSEQIDLATGARSRIGPAPRAAFGPFVWTGAAMLAIGAAGTMTTGNGRDVSKSGVWDPATRKWAALPPEPNHDLDPSTAVWAGDRVLIWGGDSGSSVEFAP